MEHDYGDVNIFELPPPQIQEPLAEQQVEDGSKSSTASTVEVTHF